MKFNLTVNDQQSEGFKLTFSTDNQDELRIAQELANALIEKIEKIEVKVTNHD